MSVRRAFPILAFVLGAATAGWIGLLLRDDDSARETTTRVPRAPGLLVSVANVTRGDLEYHESIQADVDDVIKIQFWLAPHQSEVTLSSRLEWTPEGSRIEANVRRPEGVARGGARVSPSFDRAYLGAIDGSVTWRHALVSDANTYVEEALVTSAFPAEPLVLPPTTAEENVTLLIRLFADVVATDTSIRQSGLPAWSNHLIATPGDEVEVLIETRSEGNTEVENLAVGCRLPHFLAYLPGTTRVATSRNPDGAPSNDNITTGGIDIGHYSPGANAFIIFAARIVRGADPGEHDLRVTCVSQADNTLPARDRATVRLLVPNAGTGLNGGASWYWLLLAVMACLIFGGMVAVTYDGRVGVALGLSLLSFVVLGLVWGKSEALATVGTVVTVIGFLALVRGHDRRERRPFRIEVGK